MTTKLAVALCSVLVAAPALAADPITIEVGSVAPEGTPWSELLERVKKRVEAQAKDRVKLKLYWGGRLGGEKEMVRETREGRIQMLGASTAAFGTLIPELYALEAPFLFSSSEEADFVLDGHVKPHAEKLLAEKGFVFFQWAENGWHGLAMKGSCVKSLDDLRGKKVRSQEATIHLDAFRALGANPVEMAVPEVLPALQQGVVDGFSNTPLFSFATSWYQGIGFYTVTNHIYQPAIVVYSKQWFDALPKDLQGILLAEAAADQAFGRRGVRELSGPLLDNFTNSKIEVCQVNDALRKEMTKATEKIFAEYEKKAVSKDGKALFAAIKAGKKAWAARKQ